MRFEPHVSSEMMAPLLVEKALSDIPIFGPEQANIGAAIEAALRPTSPSVPSTELTNALEAPLPKNFHTTGKVSGKLRALRTYVREQVEHSDKMDAAQSRLGDLNALKDGTGELPLASNGFGSCHEIHEALLSTLVKAPGLPREAQSVVDHAMLLRAKEKYLFDAATNRSVVVDDPWIRFAWDWIAGWSLLCTRYCIPS